MVTKCNLGRRAEDLEVVHLPWHLGTCVGLPCGKLNYAGSQSLIHLTMLAVLAGCSGDIVPADPPAPSSQSSPSSGMSPTRFEVALQDGFEGEQVSEFWRPGNAGSGRYEPGAVAISSEYARNGSSCVRITVHEGDREQTGDDGQLTERAELDSGKHALVGREAWYGFSVLVPPDFPIVDNRLIISQWKQNGVGGSPLVAQRYRDGRHELTIRRPDATLWKRFSLPKLETARWNDMIYQIRFSTDPDGFVNVWMNGQQVASYKGVTAFEKGESTIYHKIGLYRDRWKEPMTIYFDNYTLGDSRTSVDPSRLDPSP